MDVACSDIPQRPHTSGDVWTGSHSLRYSARSADRPYPGVMSEMPLEDLPGLASAAHRAAEGGQVVYLTEHGQRLAAILPTDAYENYKRLQAEDDARRVREALADDRPGRSFDSVEDMMREAGLS